MTFAGPITSMELSPQTNRLVVTSGKTVSFIPALPNGNQTHRLTLPYAPSSASIHPILQDRFVTGSLGDEWVRVHDLSGEERDVLKGHHGPVHCVEFSPDGEMFASGSGKCQDVYPFCGQLLTCSYLFLNQRTAQFDFGKQHLENLTGSGKGIRLMVVNRIIY